MISAVTGGSFLGAVPFAGGSAVFPGGAFGLAGEEAFGGVSGCWAVASCNATPPNTRPETTNTLAMDTLSFVRDIIAITPSANAAAGTSFTFPDRIATTNAVVDSIMVADTFVPPAATSRAARLGIAPPPSTADGVILAPVRAA